MTTQLTIYNEALRHIGERRLASTSEAREPRYVLDDAYTDVLAFCLEQGMWNFALVSSGSLSSAGTGSFGYSRKFTKPAALVHLFQVSDSASFTPPFSDFVEEAGFYHSSATNLYLRYVSNDGTTGGGNLTLWTNSYARYVAVTLAANVCYRITSSAELTNYLFGLSGRFLLNALAIDSLRAPPGLLPFNQWARFLMSADLQQTLESKGKGAPGKLPFGEAFTPQPTNARAG